MAQWLYAQYRDFYDLPRMIVARSDLATFLFYSRFEETADEYAGCYEVYRMPSLSENVLAGMADYDRYSKTGTSRPRASVSLSRC
jgi:hypothetical protein